MLETHAKFHSSNGKRLVLIVDDEAINRELLNLVLQDDFETIFAADGKTALETIREKHDVLSLILLDLLMPGMNGLDLIKILKNDQDLKDIPVIVLTADQEAEVTSLQLGASDFIPKPYPKKDVILTRVLRAIELYEDRDVIHHTERDPLTDLYNREYFYRYAQQFDQHHKDMEMDAILVDVHHFRMINERYGKAYGDDVLRRIGEKMREMVRDSGGIVCRREADTFLVYCPHREDYERILENASINLSGDNTSVNRIRLRMGVYANVDKSIDMERRFDRAKMAADTVRGNILKGYALYDNQLYESEIYAEHLLEDFPAALNDRQFTVYYQPKFDVHPDIPVLASAEALVRWQHPSLGLISPGVFIPLFEENGLIQQLDHYVWRMAAAQIKEWKERFCISVPVSVNVSRIDMYDPYLVETFQAILDEYDLSAGELLLEITESAYTQDSAQIISTVNRLRDIGFRIEMDDFGTGYSSLNMISSLPIDALKLDMRFIRNAFCDGRDTRLIEVIIDIADYLSVPVIAEGVETEEQLQALRAMGCDMVQGYYFSKPVPAGEYEIFIEQRKQQTESEVYTDLTEGNKSSDRTVSASIAHALTSGFEVIYYIDTESGQYVQFSSQGRYEDLQIERSGRDFFGDTQRNILRVIFPEDQERVSVAMQKDTLLSRLGRGHSFSMTYRLVLDGQPVYYNLRAVNAHTKDDHHIVIGISNVEDQILQANIVGDSQAQNHQFFSIAQALSSDFESIYYVDLISNDYTEFTAQGAYEELQIELSGTDFFAECQKNLLSVVWPDDQRMVSYALQKDVLLAALDNEQSYSMIYRLTIDNAPVYYQMKIVLAEDSRHLVIGVSNMEAQMKRQEEYETAKAQNITYSRIAQALSKDYFSIYLVNTDTDEFIEYSSSDEYQDLQVEQNGVNFFEDCRRNILRLVHEEDKEMALSVWDKSRLMPELENGRTFSSTYRLMMDGQPVYINCKVIRMTEENDRQFILIGISNVDAQMKRERELNAIREKANRDALTGVKSKHAYVEMSSAINAEIESGDVSPFAVAVCDVNGLKTVNDTYGHQAGDQLILDASHTICEIFKHSPVFRVGGDEFVVIMRGQDYEHRSDLVACMQEKNRQNEAAGGVIIACGESAWISGTDQSIEDVFARADACMYQNKTTLKGHR